MRMLMELDNSHNLSNVQEINNVEINDTQEL